jgi:nitrogen fixation/metabolism regulation signal transduction histidine kinase
MPTPDRSKKFIDPKVQGALIRRLIIHWVAFLLVASLVSFCLQVLSNPFRSMGEHVQQLWWTHGPFLLVMVFLLPVFVLDTVKLSHRFAGPIYRMRKVIREIAEGNPPPRLKFRDFDFWHGLADDFNQMVDRLAESRDRAPAEDESVATDAEHA